MQQTEIKVVKDRAEVIVCPVRMCKKLARQGYGVDNKLHFFCFKHGYVEKNETLNS